MESIGARVVLKLGSRADHLLAGRRREMSGFESCAGTVCEWAGYVNLAFEIAEAPSR